MTNARIADNLNRALCYDRDVIDRTCVEGLRVEASVGVYDFEYKIKQTLVIDVVAHADLTRAGQTDDLQFAVDYDRIAKVCREVATEQHHRLIETIATQIAERTLAQLSQVMMVDVRVAKPGAVPDAASVAVEIQRAR